MVCVDVELSTWHKKTGLGFLVCDNFNSFPFGNLNLSCWHHGFVWFGEHVRWDAIVVVTNQCRNCYLNRSWLWFQFVFEFIFSHSIRLTMVQFAFLRMSKQITDIQVQNLKNATKIKCPNECSRGRSKWHKISRKSNPKTNQCARIQSLTNMTKIKLKIKSLWMEIQLKNIP